MKKMTDASFSVNSELFDRLLLPGIPHKSFCFQKIVILSNLWENRRTCFGKVETEELLISRETFNKDCLYLDVIDNESSLVLYTLCKHYFGTEINSKELLLALFIQLFTIEKQRLTRSSSIEKLSVETWPRRKENHLKVEKEKPVKVLEEDDHVIFLKKSLDQLWTLLQNESLDPDPVFNHLLTPYLNGVKVSLKDALTSRTNQPSYLEVPEFITQRLKVCDNGVLTCIRKGRRLAWILGDNTPKMDDKCPKMATDAHLYKDRKNIVLNKLNDITLGKSSDTLKDGTVKLHRVRNSYLYLLSPLESITITKCTKVRIVTGPVQTIVRVRDCSNLELITTAKIVLLEGTINSRLYVNSEEQIVVDGPSCSQLVLSPYSVNINGLAPLESSVFQQEVIILRQPPNRNRDDIVQIEPELKQFMVPFQELNLSSDGFSSNTLKNKKVDEWENFLEKEELTGDEKVIVDDLVSNMFNKWCMIQKRSGELNGLISLNQKTSS